MDFKTYAQFVHSEQRAMLGERTPAPVEVEVLALSNALGGECGELQNVVKKIISKDLFFTTSPFEEAFVLEAGDTLWYLVRLIQKMGLDVEDVMAANVAKLKEKYKGVDTWRK